MARPVRWIIACFGALVLGVASWSCMADYVLAEGPPSRHAHSLLVSADGSNIEDADPELVDEYVDEEAVIAEGEDLWRLAPHYSSGDWFRSGCWYSEIEFVILARMAPKERTIAVDTAFPPLAALNANFSQFPSVLTTSQAGFAIRPGARITVGRYLGRDVNNREHSVEFSFFGLHDWENSAGLNAASIPGGTTLGLLTPLDPGFFYDPNSPISTNPATLNPTYSIGGFNRADTHTIAHQSDLNSFEVNIRMRRSPGRDQMIAGADGAWSLQMTPSYTPSFTAGLRFLRVEEGFQWISRQDGVALSVYRGDYLIDTSNNLFGFQIGGDVVWQEAHLSFGARGKIGAFVNFTEQHSVVLINDTNPPIAPVDTTDRNVGAKDEVMSMVAEASFFSSYHFNPHVAVRGNFDMAWIQGLAVAPDQLTFNLGDPAKVNTNGNAFYIGVGASIEFSR